jgi:integrase
MWGCEKRLTLYDLVRVGRRLRRRGHTMPKTKGKPHPIAALNDARVRSITKPGRYADGNGLHLVVSKTGGKSWLLRVVVRGVRRDIGIGGLGLVSLTQARDRARTLRLAIIDGIDPIAERRKAVGAPTFKTLAMTIHTHQLPTWKNAKHGAQWLSTLETYAFPVIGDTPVDRIDQRDVLKVLGPIWTDKPETARRVRQRLGVVFDWAKAHGHRSGDSPMTGIELGLPKQKDAVEHMAALGFDKLAAFITALRSSGADDVTKLCLEYTILTAARPGEARLARWDEFDMAGKVRTIPKDRMKASAEHVVPMSPRVIEIIEQAAALRRNGNELVFPSRTGVALSDATLAKLARSLGFGHLTAHGFRSTFRDWASECTTFPSEVVEKALAHSIKNKVEAAYRRGDLLAKRRELMNAWADFACGRASGANVVAFPAMAGS